MSNIVLCATCEYTQADFDRIKANGGEPLIVKQSIVNDAVGYWADNLFIFAGNFHARKDRTSWLVWQKSSKCNPAGDLKEMYSCDMDGSRLPFEEDDYFCFFNVYVEQLHAVDI